MNKKRIYIEVLLLKGVYKEESTGRQLYEMSEQELWNLLKGDGENEMLQVKRMFEVNER